MQKRIAGKRVAALLAAAAVTGVAMPAAPARAAQTIRIDGSSTVYPITEAVAEEFQRSERGRIRVTVGISGSGGGFKKFCRGETDISDASRPIKKVELERCRAAGIRFLELPVAFDAISVVVNPANRWVKALSVEQLKEIWAPAAQDRVTRWNQIDPSWPDRPLRLFGPGTDSGTFDYFTKAIVGEEGASRGDYTASEDDNVLVQGVAMDAGGLGYFGFAYYWANRDRLRAVPIRAHEDAPAVLPSPEAVQNGTYQPLSRPIFVYVKAASLERPAVERFVRFYLEHAAQLVREVGYVPLPADAYRLDSKRVEQRETGTVFRGGSTVGVSITELLSLERTD